MVKGIQKPIHLAEDVEKYLSTNKRKNAHHVVTLKRKYATVSYIKLYVYIPVFTTIKSIVDWAKKAKRRRTTGTGRMRYMKHLPRLFKNGFREGDLYL